MRQTARLACAAGALLLLAAASAQHPGVSYKPQPGTEAGRAVLVPGHQAKYGDAWPDAGLDECWADATSQSTCPLPREEGVTCLPGSPYEVAQVNHGWSMETRDQGAGSMVCKTGVHCAYACQPGYEWMYFDQGQDAGYAWSYDKGRQGVLCGADGRPQLTPNKPMCLKYKVLFAEIENQMDAAVYACRTNYPGDERQVFPTKIPARSRRAFTPGSPVFWHGPQYRFVKPHYYLGIPGKDLLHSCIWNYTTMDGSSHLPYQFSANFFKPTGIVDPSTGRPMPESFEPSITWAADISVFPNVFWTGKPEDVPYDVELACVTNPGHEAACTGVMNFTDALSGWAASMSAWEAPTPENGLRLVLRLKPKGGSGARSMLASTDTGSGPTKTSVTEPAPSSGNAPKPAAPAKGPAGGPNGGSGGGSGGSSGAPGAVSAVKAGNGKVYSLMASNPTDARGALDACFALGQDLSPYPAAGGDAVAAVDSLCSGKCWVWEDTKDGMCPARVAKSTMQLQTCFEKLPYVCRSR